MQEAKHLFRTIYIEILNTCNLNCSFCEKNHRLPRWMSVEEFTNIIKQVLPHTKNICLHVQGEPLMHPQFEKILSICDHYSAQVHLVTNGTFLSNYPNLINHPSLYKVSFSLQSIEYQQLNHIDSYLKPIMDFCEYASMQKHPYCELRFWRDDQLHMPNTEKALSWIYTHYEPVNRARPNQVQLMPYVRMDFDHAFEWPTNIGTDSFVKGTCHGAIDQLAILSNGCVVPCCLDADGHINLGNIFEMPFNEIIHSSRYQKMCEGFKKHIVYEPFCQSCTFRHQFD